MPIISRRRFEGPLREIRIARVFIKRTCEDPGNEKEFIGLIRKLRTLVPLQPGYLWSKYVKKIDPPKDIVAISTWISLGDWQNWIESEERREITETIFQFFQRWIRSMGSP